MLKNFSLAIVLLATVYACSNKMQSATANGDTKKVTSNTSPDVQQSIIDPAASSSNLSGPRRGEVLFLGNVGKHHDAGKYAPWLAISLFKIGVNVTYTTNLNDLNPETLNKYDGLIIYSNHDIISPSQEAALKSFVEGGKGLIPIHCAAGCFRNSDWYIKTVGAQYLSETKGNFTVSIVDKTNPITRDLWEFDTWDEKYVHQKVNPDMNLLMERVEDGKREPWTWTRKQGKGRVFYTAYGHNDSTWTQAGFMKLINNGVLWALGDDVKDRIAKLNRPEVSIYQPEIAGDFTKRHLVPKMQDALSPENSMKLTQVPVDFEVKFFAGEPDITNPIAMSWDEKGRLWIVESVDYPNTFLETDGAANDRIKICEDTNGDGRADKFTVFADSLNIPTSMVFANGGVVVSMAPYFLFLKDTNGDDKADVREILMNGWDKGDTHFGPSNLQYGFDNKIWGVVGSGFNGITKDGKSLNFRTGVYHVKPDGTDFEFLANTSNNTWGLGFSEDNNVFISTANNTHSAFYSMPSRMMQRSLQSKTDKDEAPSILPVQKIDGHYDSHSLTPNLRQVDVVGGFTSAAGHHLYTARNFPREYWNRMALVCEPTVRLLHNAIIEPKGAGFVEKDNWNLMASSDEWFGPVQAEVGPDGAVWVADWYNFIIQHNVFVERQAPSEMVLPFKDQPRGQGNAFISPLRDIDFGRIYRVVYKNAKTVKPLKLSKNDVPGLLLALENDNMFWRMTAQRLLVELNDPQVLPSLYSIIINQRVDEVGLNSPAVHALWTLQGMKVLEAENTEAFRVVVNALSHAAAGVRKAAIQVLPKNQRSLDAIGKSGILNDPNLNTRLAAFVAIADMPASKKLGEMVYMASLKEENEIDQWISKALLAAAITHEEGFTEAAAMDKAGDLKRSTLNERIGMALNEEKYALPRRGNFQNSPDVKGKEIVVKGTISKPEQRELKGVIMAQGDKENGYVLHITDGKLKLEVRQDGKAYQAFSKEALPNKFDFEAVLSTNGSMRLNIDDKEVATGKAPSSYSKNLTQDIRVGQDFDNQYKVGNYEGQFQFSGNLQNAVITLNKPGADNPLKTSLPLEEKTIQKSNAAKTEKPAAPALKPITINLKVVLNVMKYDKPLITAKAGQKVTINLENPDVMQHNWLLIKPGTTQKVGAAADVMAMDPKGADKSYVPRMPEVLHFIKLINPGEDGSVTFTAPSAPGDYPFICTFPGHWRIMNGIMRIQAP